MSDDMTYDIAVSCTDDRRSYVEEVVDACKQRGISVLYDEDKTNEWWAERARSGAVSGIHVRYFVPFVSAPTDGFSAAMLAAVKRGDAHVLPVLVADVSIAPELLHPHIAYLRSDKRTPDQLADRFAAKAETQQPIAMTELLTSALQASEIGAIPADFSRYEEQELTLRYLGQQFQAIAPQLRARGLVGTVRHTESLVTVRIERRGDTIYALDIQRGGMGGDDTINFVVGLHDRSSTCTNGWARPIYDKESGRAVLEMHDLSVFGNGGSANRTYPREELFSALWNRILVHLDGVSG
jgi:hypothetical protein